MKVLTDEARRLIANALQYGVYAERLEACEPPYMAPSEDPNDYSAVGNLLTGVPTHLTTFPPVVLPLR